MNGEGKFWISVFGIGAISMLIFIAMIFGYQYKKKLIMSEMVANGASPIEAMLSLHDVSSMEQVFYLNALDKTKEGK